MRSWIALILTLLVVFAGISQAQGVIPTHPRPFLCTPPACTYPPPTISISPGTETVTNSKVFVTITMCDTVVLASDTVYLNGGVITSQFTQTTSSSAGCHVKWTLTDTVHLSLGTNTLRAEVQGENTNGTGLQQTSSSVTYTYQQPAHTATVTVSPDTAIGTVGTTTTTNFTVTNTGNVTDTLWFTRRCSGSIFTLCNPVSVDSAVLLSGHNTTVSVQWKPGTAGANGTVNLTATENNGVAASAVQTVVTAATPGLDFADVNPGVSYDRGNCLTIAMGPNAAFECEALRITHPLPAVRTMSSTKVPTLIYNWDLANTIQRIAALLTIGTQDTATLDSVRARLYKRPHGTSAYVVADNSAWWPGSDWNGTTPTVTRRIEDYWQSFGDTTGYYDLAFATTQFYSSSAHGHWTVNDSSSGQVINVNRSLSPYGAGWWLVGLERLMYYGTHKDTIVWIGGDGSTNMYVDAAGTGQLWRPVTVVGARDSIQLLGAPYNVLERMAPHNTRITFDSAHGRMGYRINRLGQSTRFIYHDSITLALDTVEVWTRHQDSLPQVWYTFIYSSGVLSQVKAPGPDTARTVVFTDSSTYTWASNSIWKIKDPDGDSIMFGRDPNALLRYDVRVDKRGDSTIYGYGLDVQGFGYSHRPLHTSGVSDITRTLLEYENMGLSVGWMSRPSIHAMPPDSTYVKHYGPRYNAGDSSDVTTIWVDKWWQPTKARDAYGHITTIRRDNPTYPTRVTQTVDPLGRIELAAYDVRGNVDSVTDLGTYLNGKYAITTYQWLPQFDHVTSVHLPAGEMDSTAYDSTFGNRKWTQDKRGTVSRVNFSYDAATEMLRSVTDARGNVDSVRYDGTLGNDSTNKSPIGFVTTFLTDKIGRDTLIKSPVDAAQTLFTHVHKFKDRMDRDTLVVTYGPASRVMSAESTFVRATYDQEGAPLTATRTEAPDPGSIGTLTSTFVYDPAGRRIKSCPVVSTSCDVDSLDAAGNIAVHTDRRGYHTRFVYDSLNRLVRRTTDSVPYAIYRSPYWVNEVNPVGYGLQDTLRFPHYVNRAASHTYVISADTATFKYDVVGRLIQANNKDAQIGRSYNLNGTLATDTLRIRTVATHDTLFVTNIGGVSTPVDSVAIDFDSAGDFTHHQYVLAYAYDLEKRRTSLQYPLNIVYHSAGGAPFGTVTYAYDATTGVLDSVTDFFGHTSHYYDGPSDNLDSLNLPGLLHQKFTYDADDRLIDDSLFTRATTSTTTGTVWHTDPIVRAATLQYDARGKVTSAVDSHTLNESMQVFYTGLGQVDSTHNRGAYINPDASVSNFDSYEYSQVDAMGNKIVGRDSTNSTVTYSSGSMAIWMPSMTESASSGRRSADTVFYAPNTGQTARYSSQYIGQTPTFQHDTDSYDKSGNLVIVDSRDLTYTRSPRVSYYSADGKVRAVDSRSLQEENGDQPIVWYKMAFEQYRYDALGRRIWVRSRKNCHGTFDNCYASTTTRTIFDGSSELAEITAIGDSLPYQDNNHGHGNLTGHSSDWENDTTAIDSLYEPGNYTASPIGAVGQEFPLSAYYGRVLYVTGRDPERPVEIVRLDYTLQSVDCPPTVVDTAIFIPSYNYNGVADNGSLPNGQYMFGPYSNQCGPQQAMPPWFGAYSQWAKVNPITRFGWFGSLVQFHQDATGLTNLRNRQYDSRTGRFTQEDPIGLGGGLNAYGFAGGDPVNYSDPFGLCPPRDNDYSTCNPHRDLVLYVHGNTTAGGEIGLEGAVGAFAKNQAQLGLVDYLVLGVAGVMGAAGEAETSTGKMMGALREAASGKGNFGVGSLTAAEARSVGEAWVGEGATTASDGTTMVSKDGLRQFRPPSMKPNLGRVQANLEARPQANGAWQSNAHIDIVP